jgi:TRAP-type C4-dicarboxylate transport system permease small subunit
MQHNVEDLTEGLPASRVDAGNPADRLLALVNQLVVIASSIALVAASGVLTYSVVSRYFLHLSSDWQDEMSVFLIVGAVFMSAAAVQAQRGHVGIESIISLLSPRANRIRQIVVDIATFIFCAYFSWKSFLLLHEAWVDGYRSSSTWQPPLWIPYSLMTAGMTLLSIQLALQILAQLRGRKA